MSVVFALGGENRVSQSAWDNRAWRKRVMWPTAKDKTFSRITITFPFNFNSAVGGIVYLVQQRLLHSHVQSQCFWLWTYALFRAKNGFICTNFGDHDAGANKSPTRDEMRRLLSWFQREMRPELWSSPIQLACTRRRCFPQSQPASSPSRFRRWHCCNTMTWECMIWYSQWGYHLLWADLMSSTAINGKLRSSFWYLLWGCYATCPLFTYWPRPTACPVLVYYSSCFSICKYVYPRLVCQVRYCLVCPSQNIKLSPSPTSTKVDWANDLCGSNRPINTANLSPQQSRHSTDHPWLER